MCLQNFRACTIPVGIPVVLPRYGRSGAGPSGAVERCEFAVLPSAASWRVALCGTANG